MMFLDTFKVLLGIIDKIIISVWWIIFPPILLYVWFKLRLMYVRSLHVRSFKWYLYEIKIPADILKTPKAMEQVFAALFAAYSYGFNKVQYYLDGKTERWFSFEMVGADSKVHFYVRIPVCDGDFDFRNLFQSAVYSQYPTAEINEVNDYVNDMPVVLPNKVYDIFGTNMILSRDNYYPIKTYQYFEESQEEKRLDPIVAIAEVMSNLKKEEKIWLQYIISPSGSPTGDNWAKEGERKIGEIVGRKEKGGSSNSSASILVDWIKNLIWAPIELPIWSGQVKKEDPAMIKFLSPDEQDVVKAISNKISKLGFKAVVRFIYIDRKDSFSPANIAAIFSSFQQFSIQNLNSLKPGKMLTVYDSFFCRVFRKYKKIRVMIKKRKVYDYYRQRRFGRYNMIIDENLPILTNEELATLYHIPTMMVEAAKLRKLETKKGEPPAELPIEV